MTKTISKCARIFKPGRGWTRVAVIELLMMCVTSSVIAQSITDQKPATDAESVKPSTEAIKPEVGGAAPTTFLRMKSGLRAEDALVAKVGESVRFVLDLPTREGWSDANIGSLQIRSLGRQERVDLSNLTAEGEVGYTFDKPGWALVILNAGSAVAKQRSDAWQATPYCTKLIVRVDPAGEIRPNSRPLPDGGVTGKVGMKVELLPYIAPYGLAVTPSDPNDPKTGSYVPVRVYFDGISQKSVKIHAYGPEGAHTTAVTGKKGIANVKLTRAGRWLIRYQKAVDGEIYTGDLVFDAPGEAKKGARG